MRPIFKSITLAAMTLQVAVNLQAQANDGESVLNKPIPAEVLDSLRVELISPNVSGARDLIKSGECTISGSELSIELATGEWMKGGVYRVQVSATFGTQTEVIYALDVTVPRYTELASEPQEYEDIVSVVVTFGSESADPNVYGVGESGEEPDVVQNVAKIHGHSVEMGYHVHATGEYSVAEGDGTIASGYTAHAEGNATTASGANSHAEGAEGVTASGNASHAEGNNTLASNDYCHAEGVDTTANGEAAHAEGSNTVASGKASHAEGTGTIAAQSSQSVCGTYNVEDEDDTFAFIVGNGADDEHRHNAFAVTKDGKLALFKADGTPVILDAATLEALIASV